MRRLYVGGLSHSITKKDLKDRFGKFGDVQDVELRTRRDEDGVPYKTFGYININISDADLKKCFTVLNKSKWKGGTLQIETAKESFLHRLAEERQMAAEQQLQLTAAENKRQKLLDSLSKAGVENFTMKAAVPGTEVPGHKDWVVSKFGRVLPVLQLRCQKGNRARILKYNPSKYSHNIRKLAQTTSEQATPICQLTWELQGGDDDISRKRRGEFPPYELSRPKKSRTETVISHNAAGKSRSEQTVHSVNHTKAHQFSNGFKQPPNQRLTQRRGAHFADSDVDSDEEIRRLVAAQPISHGALQQELEDDNLEVVGLDFLGCSRQQQKGRTGDKDQDDYDSADTDELLSSRKPPPLQDRLTPFTARQLSGKNTDRRRKTKNKCKAMEQEEEEDSADSVKQTSQKQGSSTSKNLSNMSALPVVKLPESGSDEDDEDDEVLESDDSCSDSDYEAMFSNVTHLEISLPDLQRLAEESQLTSQTTAPSIISTRVKQETNLKSSPTEQPAPKKGTLPEEILAAIMGEDSSEDDRKKEKKKRKGVISAPLPAFQGTRALNKGLEANESLKRQTEEEGTGCMDSEAPQLSHRATDIKTSRSALKDEEIEEEENTEEEEEEKSEISFSSSSNDEEEEKNEEAVYNMTATKLLKTVPNKVPVSPEKSETSSSSSSDDDEEEEQAPPRVPLGAEEEAEWQRKANLRRLAAVQQRQKEAEEHKRLIQGALAKLDTPTAGAGKHIIFGSDDDDDDGSDEDEQLITSEVTMSKKTLLQDSHSEEEAIASQDSTKKKKKRHLKPLGPQLFGSSEDEEDDEEEDGRFDIRPQFEGRAGQKLMELQSRFGTDERFRMDSRFLEEDEDKEEESERKRSVTEEDESLEEERKKNLSILQSVLSSSQQTCSSKTAGKAKTFRDISALHYDPSKEDHAAFETKTEETKRESKSARKKKREEAQKLPEVSKEIYYDVSGDLKAVFGPTEVDIAEEKEKTNWDQEEEDESETKDEEPTLLSSIFSADPSAEKEASTGFKFSFFGDETETESRETEYKVESIQAPKVSWQQDPRFHDSSSEEDEDDDEDDDEEVEEEDVEPSRAAPKTTE